MEMRKVDEICSVLDGCADDIVRAARTLAIAKRSPQRRGLKASFLEAKLSAHIATCCYVFHEWEVQKKLGCDDARWQMYNDRFVALLEMYCPKALDEMSMRYAA